MTSDRDAARYAQDQLAHRAMHDPLTGLPVRWVFLEQLAHALARLARHPGHVGVLFLDLDKLKYVNDTYGHAASDDLLSTCVERLQAAVRPSDVVARIGGDEFVVLLEDVDGTATLERIAQRVLDGRADAATRCSTRSRTTATGPVPPLSSGSPPSCAQPWARGSWRCTTSRSSTCGTTSPTSRDPCWTGPPSTRSRRSPAGGTRSAGCWRRASSWTRRSGRG